MTYAADRISRVISAQRRRNIRDLIEASMLGAGLLVTLIGLL